MTLKNDAKFEEELICRFKNDINNLTRPLKSLKNRRFSGLLLNKVYNVLAKKNKEELCLMALKIDKKFLKEN